MSISPLVLWGAKGHAKVLREFLEPLGFQIVAVFDNDPATVAPFPGVPLYIGEQGLKEWQRSSPRTGVCFLVAVGGARGKERIELHDRLVSVGLHPIVAVHPRAFVARDALLGPGTQVLAGACVCTEVSCGRSCIINTGASVDHESNLGHGVHVAPGVTIAGCVEIGDCALIGAGAVVLPRVRVGRNVIVGAGSVVTRDIPDDTVAWGNPARVVRSNP
jgi:sugar O-acyltransferase (sialic acid O-acetyltransferase NeuD family)